MKRRLVMIEIQPTATGARLLEVAIERGFELLLLTDDDAWFRANSSADTQARTTVIPVEWQMNRRAQILDILPRFERASLAGIMTVRDRFIEAVSEVAGALGLPFTDSGAVAICRNKERTRAVADEIGVRNPRYQAVASLQDAQAFCQDAGFPVVLKPSKGSGAAGVMLCADGTELARVVPAMLEDCARTQELLLIEAFVPGPEVGVETVTFQGHTMVLGVTNRGVVGPHPRFTTVSWTFPAQVPAAVEHQLKTMAPAILTRIGYGLGYAHTQFVLGADGPVLVEINPRIAGRNIAPLIAGALGIDVLGIMVDLFTGADLSWLLETEFAPRHTMTELWIKPEREGIVMKLAGVDLARRFPGIVSIVEGLKPGEEVLDRHGFLTHAARIVARGQSAFESLVCARAASTAIQLKVAGGNAAEAMNERCAAAPAAAGAPNRREVGETV